jgi:dTDP-4-amino-4,6-dideoxygalactose transaminase
MYHVNAADWIPFNRPYLVGSEIQHMRDAVQRGHISGDGWYSKRCQEVLQTLTGSRMSLLTTSCTHALEMSALLLDLKPGDEVILPSFTFVSTANAFALRGATLVFADIRADTLNIDERLLPDLITARTKAIVVVHYAGVACEMDAILALARRHDVAVVEDNAHGLGGSFRGRPLGSFGKLATLSFHETKNIHCGEGGALLINDDELLRAAEIVRDKGTNRSEFFRGEVDKYTWVALGSSYLPSDLLGAYLYAQLEAIDLIQERRLQIWKTYERELCGWSLAQNVQMPTVPEHIEHPAHLFYLLLQDVGQRAAFIDHMASAGVHAVFHYVPLHSSPQGLALAGKRADCPVTDAVSDRLVRLPLYAGLSESACERVVEAARSFRH